MRVGSGGGGEGGLSAAVQWEERMQRMSCHIHDADGREWRAGMA